MSAFAVMGAAFMVPALGLTSSPIAAADGVPLVHGDVLASVGSGTVDNYSPTGTLNDTLDTTTGATYTTGGCFDSSGNFYVTDFGSDEISKFNSSGNLVNADWASPNNTPESCTVDASGDVYVGGPTQPSGPTIYEYNSSGTQINAFSVTGGSGTGGTDWVDLAADQQTMLYTGEGSEILSYNTSSDTQNPDFATGLPAPCFALRIRPNGDVMVTCASEVLRFNSAGTLLQTYTVPDSETLFAMNLDPDNTSFWTGDAGTGEVYHIDIASGTILGSFSASGPDTLYGLTLVGEINVAAPTLVLTPPTNTQAVGTTDTVTATITNPGGSISGQTVDFSVSGVNGPMTGTGTTNASGVATFSYVGTNAGTDTVTGTFGSATGTASVTWTRSSGSGTDLAVSLTNAASTLHAGRSMTYCLTATDNGPFTATGVSVVLTLPSGVTVTNAGGGTVSANTLTWSVAKLLTGKHVNFKVTVQDTATSGTTLTATASVAGSPAPDPNLSNNSASSSTTIT
ncbi:MAG: hypothetical protein WB565_02095 [Acidimicrobiales bacterium]